MFNSFLESETIEGAIGCIQESFLIIIIFFFSKERDTCQSDKYSLKDWSNRELSTDHTLKS